MTKSFNADVKLCLTQLKNLLTWLKASLHPNPIIHWFYLNDHLSPILQGLSESEQVGRVPSYPFLYFVYNFFILIFGLKAGALLMLCRNSHNVLFYFPVRLQVYYAGNLHSSSVTNYLYTRLI